MSVRLPPAEAEKAPKDLPDDDEIYKDIVDLVTSRRATRPGVLRAAPAGRVLQDFGAVLRMKEVDPEKLYQLGSSVETIQEFWSHNWHTSANSKVWLLLMLKNGKAASVFGCIVALIVAVLSYMELLPAWARAATYKTAEVQVLKTSPWSLLSGVLAAFLTIVFWRSKDQVFLDRACIHQGDTDLKTEGILNIAAFLQNSKSLVVIWDRAYMSRAWCVFELAAFLSSHRNVKPIPVVVKPLELAPLTCWMIVAISASMLYEICLPSDGLLLYGKVAALAFWAVAFNFIFRRLLKDIVTVEDECRNFSWDTVQANCCSVGHVENGIPIPCDREMLSQCISRWFGSVQAFEESVRTDVRDLCVAQLLRVPMGYTWLVVFSTFVLWGHLDIAVSRAHAGDAVFAAGLALSGVAWTCWIMPVRYIVLGRLAMWQSKGGNWLIVNVLGILNVFTGHLLQQGTYLVFWPNAFLASSVFMIVSFFTDVVVYVVLTRYCPLGVASAASAQSSSHAASAQSGSQ